VKDSKRHKASSDRGAWR